MSVTPLPTSKHSSRAFEVWVRLLRGHAAMGRALSTQLRIDQALSFNQAAALLLLIQAEGNRMRRVDLADGLQLTRSGITRLVDGLENHGLVEKGASQHDARVSYAVLTDAGRDKLEHDPRLSRSSIAAAFSQRYSDQELDTLIELLGRLAGATDWRGGRVVVKR